MRLRVFWTIAILLVASGFSAPAYAQYHYGIRAGVSGRPDQVYIGAHVDSPSLGHATTFRPNVELGFGGKTSRFGADTFLLAANLELVHWMPLPDTSWKLYAGGGPGAIFDNDGFDKALGGGLAVVFGLQHKGGLFVEVKTGTLPSIKVAVGFQLK